MALITGTSSNDFLNGTDFDDIIQGLAGNDTIVGLAGNDLINGNQGNDLANGNLGNDTVYGGQGNDTVFGGQGNDIVNGNFGDDIVNGNASNDTVYGGQGNDTVYGGAGDDQEFGDKGNDVLYGDLGNNTLTGGTGFDVFVVTPTNTGSDIVTDFSTAEDYIGLTGGLTFAGLTIAQSGANTTISSGSKLLVTLNGITASNLTSANFTTTLSSPTAGPSGSPSPSPGPSPTPGNLGTVIQLPTLGPFSGTGSTTFTRNLSDPTSGTPTTSATINSFQPGTNDRLQLATGNAALDLSKFSITSSGTGTSVNYTNGSNSANTDLTSIFAVTGANQIKLGTVTDFTSSGTFTQTGSLLFGGGVLDATSSNGGTGNDLIAITDGTGSVLAGAGNDLITGGTSTDTIDGGAGNDTINGGSGNDTIIGGAGPDTLTGGSGSNRYTYNSPSEGGDVITDFSANNDIFAISRNNFGGGLTGNDISSSQFTTGIVATTADQRFIYDTNTGILRFDVDGTGSASSQIIATLSSKPSITNTNFLVF